MSVCVTEVQVNICAKHQIHTSSLYIRSALIVLWPQLGFTWKDGVKETQCVVVHEGSGGDTQVSLSG